MSIRLKTAAVFFFVFVAILLPVNVIVFNRLQRTLEQASQREMQVEAQKLLAQVKTDPVVIPAPAPGYAFRLTKMLGELEVELHATTNFPEWVELVLPRTYFRLDSLEIFVQQNRDERGAFNLVLARSADRLREELATLKSYLFLSLTISVFFSGSLIYLITGYLLKPVTDIAQVATEIDLSKSNKRVRVPVANDETRQLAEAINLMLSRIDQDAKNQTYFFAAAAHELKTPLAVMKAELAVRPLNPDSLLHELQRLENTVEDFTILALLKSEKLQLRLESLGFDELVYAALRKLRFASQSKQTVIQVTIPEVDLPRVMADAFKMEAVLINLIENAIRHSAGGGAVVITVAVTQKGLNCAISNPVGVEISNPNAFRREFTKSDAFTPGMGMGLWICDRILALHGFAFNLACTSGQFTATINIPRTDSPA